MARRPNDRYTGSASGNGNARPRRKLIQPMSAQKVRITDLANPVLTDVQKQALALAEQFPLQLEADAVLNAACAATGLTNFGDNSFRPRLALWLECCAQDDGLSAVGRAAIFGQAVNYATQRLYLEDLIQRHPEIESVDIDRPLIIAGLPRSGTTYTLALMAGDPRLRSLPHWEGVRPVAEPYIVDGKDTRYELAEQDWAQSDSLLPFTKLIHEFAPDHITEDIELQGMDFGGYYIEWTAHVPRWRDFQFSTDRTPWLRYMHRAMQALTWQQGPNRWVTKCPQHMEQLTEVNAVLTGAFTVITHRDPVASIQSAITGTAYAARLLRKSVDREQFAEYWIDRYERLLRACVRDRDALDPARSYDLYFDELMADPMGELKAIYQAADLPFDDTTRAGLETAMTNNKRGKHGQLEYDLRGDFGLDPDAIRERFAFYFDRFPKVRVEVQ
ncbi:sulfotransferase family protein [Mycobacterium sp. MMS18-G62]